MKLIADNEFEIGEVMKNLTEQEKVDRLKGLLYTLDEILEILGYYDGSLEDESVEDIDKLLELHEHEGNFEEAYYHIAKKYAICNGNFEEAIARNAYLPL